MKRGGELKYKEEVLDFFVFWSCIRIVYFVFFDCGGNIG
jgi:hypothetical protein